jgi:hypothetical protein
MKDSLVVSFSMAPTRINYSSRTGTFNQQHFQHILGLDTLDDKEYADIKGNVSAMVQIGSVGGALL